MSVSVAESARIARFHSSVSAGHCTLPRALNCVPGNRTRERSTVSVRPSIVKLPTTSAIDSFGSLLSVASLSTSMRMPFSRGAWMRKAASRALRCSKRRTR